MGDFHEVTAVMLEDGYTYKCHGGTVTVERFGEPWRTEPEGDKALISLIHECADLQQKLADYESVVEQMREFISDTEVAGNVVWNAMKDAWL